MCDSDTRRNKADEMPDVGCAAASLRAAKLFEDPAEYSNIGGEIGVGMSERRQHAWVIKVRLSSSGDGTRTARTGGVGRTRTSKQQTVGSTEGEHRSRLTKAMGVL
jgi:hypothetical protein